MLIPLVRADAPMFEELRNQWMGQLEGEDMAPEEYFKPYMEQAKRIVSEDPADPTYGIFTLISDRQDGGPSYEGFVHINHAKPRNCVRFVWQFLAPKYDVDEVQPAQIARLFASYVVGGINLCRNEMQASSLHMYLPNRPDRQLAAGACAMIGEDSGVLRIATRSSWLHIDNIAPAE